MKKIYTIIFTTAFSLFVINANAVTIPVSITSNTFTPTSFNASIGDVVVWTLNAGSHTTASILVPGGAATWDSGTMSVIGSTYSYTITTAGTYGYHCAFHPNMIAGFTVTSVGIPEPSINFLISAFPNPFTDKITFNYKGIEKIEVFNVIGKQVKSIETTGNEGTIEMNFEGLTAGIYFYRTYKDGIVVETRKIVKAK